MGAAALQHEGQHEHDILFLAQCDVRFCKAGAPAGRAGRRAGRGTGRAGDLSGVSCFLFFGENRSPSNRDGGANMAVKNAEVEEEEENGRGSGGEGKQRRRRR